MAVGNDALSAALKMSFGGNGNGQQQVMDDRTDLLKDAENSFYGGGNAPIPTPTPTPAAPKPSKMTLEDLYNHFGVENPVQVSRPTNSQPIYQNKPDQQIYDWRSNYGWSNA